MADNNYFIDFDKLYDYYPDSLIATDEWEILRYQIVQELNNCNDEDKRVDEFYLHGGLPCLPTFEWYLKRKLIKSGFKKEDLNNPFWLNSYAYSRRNDYEKPEIAAALEGLVSIRKLKDILLSNGKKPNRDAIRIFLYSLEAIINLFRAGVTPALARAEVRKTKNSLETRNLKKRLIELAIRKIFDSYPKMKRTLGEVYNKVDVINQKTPIINPETGEKVDIRTGKDKRGKEVVFITSEGITFDPYEKRSLQRFINALK